MYVGDHYTVYKLPTDTQPVKGGLNQQPTGTTGHTTLWPIKHTPPRINRKTPTDLQLLHKHHRLANSELAVQKTTVAYVPGEGEWYYTNETLVGSTKI